MSRALLTDLYELNMAASYLRRGMTAQATFSLFVRNVPPRWGFLVACGLESCLDYLESYRFDDRDLEYLRSELGFREEDIAAFRDLRFTGEVRAVPEGRVVFEDEPLLEVTAPLPEAQLVETYLLNQVTYQTAVASKAARCRIAAADAKLIDFSMRRVHGGEASLGVARATAVAGFVATSNVEAARTLGIPATGTMAHSYIEAFPSEREAFEAYAEDFPDHVALLVDTYDTARGVEKAIDVARNLASSGVRLTGIRLDSGDLAALAKEARRALDEAGMEDTEIIASGGLDEDAIAALVAAGAPIDTYGVGTKIGVAEDAPAPDTVYKLVQYDDEPVCKLSRRKATLPGRKQVWRRPGARDEIGLLDEDPPSDDAEPLLVRVMVDGRRQQTDTLERAAERFASDLAALPPSLRRLDANAPVPAPTDELLDLAKEVYRRIDARELDRRRRG
jgi:nicotinate phosphoribosyltransferase